MQDLHLCVQGTCGQIHPLPALRQHRGFSAQHVQVVAQACLIALKRNGICRFGRCLRGILLSLLAAHGLGGSDAVSHLVHGLNHLGVVALYCRVQLGSFATQIGAQTVALKQRQTDGRAHAPLLAVTLEKFVKADT